MVRSYGPLASNNDVTPYLVSVGDHLGEGKISLDDALGELAKVLASAVGIALTDQQRSDIDTSYSQQYRQRDATRVQAQQLGGAIPPPAGGAAQPPLRPATPCPAQPAVDPNGDAARALAASQVEEFREFQAWKRARAVTPEPDTSSKRPKRPWHSLTAIVDDVTIHPTVRQTRTLVAEYAADLEATRTDLLCTSGLPVLPDTVWKSILKDEYVDLDKIHSSYNSSVDTRKRSEKLAEGLWLQTESDAPTKHISNSTDWIVTFRWYMRGVLVAFPHRAREFESWDDLISSKFRVYSTGAHKRIIALEAASRRAIFDSSDQCLLNAEVLERLVPAWMASEGTEFATASSGSSKVDRPNKKARISSGTAPGSAPRSTCNNWNSKGCTYNACRYRHVCSSCGGAHTKTACTKASTS